MAALGLSLATVLALGAIALAAGVVRGFTGFGLSAFALSLAVLILPPVELLPVMWWLEMGASLMMARGGFREADIRVAVILVGGSVVGLAAGLTLTTTIDPELSRRVALVLLIALALLQLARVRLGWLATLPGLIATGLLAGLATGLAGVGGMVIALYVLAQQTSAATMRATLVVYLFLGGILGLGVHLWVGTMTTTAAARGLVLLVPCLVGVFIGQMLFTPRLQAYYRPVCLTLLIALGAGSLLRSLT